MPATNDGAALEVFRAATVPAPCCSPPTTSRPNANPNRFYGAILTRYPAAPTTQY